MAPAPPSRGSAISGNGGPPSSAVLFYAGKIMHQRMKPVGHRFAYTVFSLMVDLDRLVEAGSASRLLSVNRRNLLSFHEADHTGTAATPLRAYVDGLLRDAGLREPPARVLLVCYPRILGLVFNPLAVYYAYDAQGGIIAMIYEVRNTFGERHTYVCPVEPHELSDAGIRQECDKTFYVSPFIPMAMRYHFRMLPPGREIRWRILETDADGPLLSATFSGQAMAVTSARVLRLVAAIPHLTVKIVAGIHWEALKLWVKGARFVSRPQAPVPTSVWRNGTRLDTKFCDDSPVGAPAE